MSELLRPSQTNDLLDEKKRIQTALKERPEMIQDKSSALKQVRQIDTMLQDQAPKNLGGKERDNAVKREAELRSKMINGMPSQEEMRKCPAGAIKKHTQWEKNNKKDLAEWKTLQLRMNVGTDDTDVANFEKHRPTKSTLNMHNQIVDGQQFHNIENVNGRAVTFSSEDLALIKERAPDMAGKLALMDNEGRQIIKQQYIYDFVEPTK
jgi:hypothetical protein